MMHLSTAFAVLCHVVLWSASAAVRSAGSFEYIVVGSGAGGGPLASRLARAGHKTLLIEAGDDQGNNINYTVPAYQAAVTQDPALRWDFFVNHYQDQTRAQKDSKYVYDTPSGEYTGLTPPAGATPKGILYPRAGTLGGCTAHNALITITPDRSDWDHIANITKDDSWSADNMEQYWNKIERNEYLPHSATGHGFDGWLGTSYANPTLVLKDSKVVKWLAAAATYIGQFGKGILTEAQTIGGLTHLLTNDPNAGGAERDSAQGFYQIPLAMSQGVRNSAQDFIIETVNAGYPLTVRTNSFVTKVTFNKASPPQATGVEFLDGSYLYSASPRSGSSRGTPGTASASKEIILSGGAYNTPQLLKLSGIGPAAELESHNIPVLVNSPGIGRNLQDRYEIGTVFHTTTKYTLLAGCTFDGKPHDKCLKHWQDNPDVGPAKGPYASNGLIASIQHRTPYASSSDIDTFIFGGPVEFTGYFPGWADAAVASHQHWTWATLKAHTRNTAGTVELRSANPLDTPVINFNYFDTGSAGWEEDLGALVDAVKLARGIKGHFDDYDVLLPTSRFEEVLPGKGVESDEQLREYIMDNAWGHHASCSVPIGADDDEMAPLDSRFRVKGTKGLRVVDASVFPTIPGVFIATAIYMVSEKAADVILNGEV